MGSVRKVSDIYRIYRNSIEDPFKDLSMDIYRDVKDIDNSSKTQIKQRRIAEQLLLKLREPRSWKFYLKCAYHLSENQIWTLVGLATRPSVRCPNRYFVYLANKEMSE